jgi:hypothetical protein
VLAYQLEDPASDLHLVAVRRGDGGGLLTSDLTLQLRSEWQGTVFQLDASEQTRGEWIDTKCTD